LGLLWLVARKLPARYRFLTAVLLEAGWEVLDNSPLLTARCAPRYGIVQG
jgi:hypothetical protein